MVTLDLTAIMLLSILYKENKTPSIYLSIYLLIYVSIDLWFGTGFDSAKITSKKFKHVLTLLGKVFFFVCFTEGVRWLRNLKAFVRIFPFPCTCELLLSINSLVSFFIITVGCVAKPLALSRCSLGQHHLSHPVNHHTRPPAPCRSGLNRGQQLLQQQRPTLVRKAVTASDHQEEQPSCVFQEIGQND